jgi:hypothetical protein
MDRRERIHGRCALSLVVVLTATAGCGNSVRELLQPLSAMTLASGAGQHDAPIKQAEGLQITKHGETAPTAEPRSDRGLTATLDTTRTRTAIPPSLPGPHLSTPVERKRTPHAKQGGE